ncbi:uncharacterized protein LOC124922569 isoform X2 [Impatiens glandulifera]|uniref:uncharacterized protein LOC124922569 isoform X2 n=1 Tax=Impatiens glandulifera TaxID=253017 RepID=UPI001FB10C0C|nr:uncharacterized protein LOC124922569 isoform X2 [Impatiens glandulifera]
MRPSQWSEVPNAVSTSKHPNHKHSGSNVFRLLVQREVSPRTRHLRKSLSVDTYRLKCGAKKDARSGLASWLEAESMLHLTAKYCPLAPPPRSTIAAAFSPDGKTLASTHGDHTVKIIDFQTGKCLKVLTGHRRTPWVVRFHPLYPQILASGSLDHEVRLWNAHTAECIGSRDFYRPIASIAFHAQGELLAVASGHKLYMWYYNRQGDASSPTIVLKTRRSLRAVHFHPHGAPFLLTAEVNDLDSSDSSMSSATSAGYSNYPPPTLFLADAHSGQYELILSPIELGHSLAQSEPQTNSFPGEMDNGVAQPAMDMMDTTGAHPEERSNQFLPYVDPAYWELRFLHGWLVGHSQAGQGTNHLPIGGHHEGSSAFGHLENHTSGIPVGMPSNLGQSRLQGRSGFVSATRIGESHVSNNNIRNESDAAHFFVSRIHSELATSLAATPSELPCTVKLRIWKHDIRNTCAPLDAGKCLLTIPHAVLCSEMGAHFSPCGRYLAACVACMLPHVEVDPGLLNQANQETGASTSPTRHPITAHQVMYELRIYSLEKATFGSVLVSRAIRAAHCLTSIQFSPTSEHLLLAYGRRHCSLLKSVVIDGEMTIPIYTILEVYRVSDMELVRVLPSAEDEVNVACFHPSVGNGLVYGTKEGKLRILHCERSHSIIHERSSDIDENMLEVPRYALEC